MTCDPLVFINNVALMCFACVNIARNCIWIEKRKKTQARILFYMYTPYTYFVVVQKQSETPDIEIFDLNRHTFIRHTFFFRHTHNENYIPSPHFDATGSLHFCNPFSPILLCIQYIHVYILQKFFHRAHIHVEIHTYTHEHGYSVCYGVL